MPELNVSRETLDRLKAFESLFLRWNPRINLVSKSSVAEFWTRHVADSLQLASFYPGARTWADFGSGGGFPAIVVAIARENNYETEFTLVESDTRKCAFLRTVIRELGLPGQVINARIEDVPPLMMDVVSARALADLDALLAYASAHLGAQGACLFQKGAQWSSEVKKAQENWRFDLEVHNSKTDKQAAVLEILNLRKA